MFDDDAARRALQGLADEPAPPVTTTLDQVVRRGRRRVLAQRASSVAVVVAVVAVIGIGAILLRPGDGSGDGVQVGNTPVSTTAPPSTMPLPGWKAVKVPVRADGSCGSGMPESGPPNLTKPSKERIEEAFTTAVREALATTRLTVEWKSYESPGAFVVIEVNLDNGPAQVRLEVATYGGTPVQAADASIGSEGTCAAPYRRVLTDGTVLQLHQDVTSIPTAPVQKLRIYHPDGLMYVITSAGFSDEDYAATGVDPRGAKASEAAGLAPKTGRGKLPMTEAQLAAAGLVLMKGLEK